MSLLAIQRDFATWLRDGDADQAPAGMRIYQNNYRASLTACLADGFARTRDWIGGEAFEQAMIAHILRAPPSSWTLDAYGRDFPDTLGQFFPDDPEVAELARLELALAEAFVTADADVLDRAEAVNVDWDSAVLRFVPSIELMPVTTNADAIWSALAKEEVPPAARAEGDRTLLVWRQDEVSCFRPLDAIEAQALRLAVSGRSFAELCEALAAAFGDAEGIQCAGTCLARWLDEGLLIGAVDADQVGEKRLARP